MSIFVLLCDFAAPNTVERVYRAHELNITLAEFRDVVQQELEAGTLVRVGRQALEKEKSLPMLLASDLFQKTSVKEVGAAFKRGHALVVDNAFRPGFAQRASAALLDFKEWAVRGGSRESLQFETRFVEPPNLPATIEWLRQALDSPATKAFMTTLSGRDCHGPLQLHASLYLPGDHINPHSDDGMGRSVAFVWNLTPSWHPLWGGEFVWLATGAAVQPRFNSLVLFPVSGHSHHLVTPVSPYATGRRLAVAGWWTAKSASAAKNKKKPKAVRSSAGAVKGLPGAAPLVSLGKKHRIVVL